MDDARLSDLLNQLNSIDASQRADAALAATALLAEGGCGWHDLRLARRRRQGERGPERRAAEQREVERNGEIIGDCIAHSYCFSEPEKKWLADKLEWRGSKLTGTQLRILDQLHKKRQLFGTRPPV